MPTLHCSLPWRFFALAFLIILFSRIPEPDLEAAKANPVKENTVESIKGALSYRHFVFGIIAIFVYVGVEVGIPNIANLYMTSPEVGIATGVAGTVVGMYWLLMLVGRLIGGAIGGKVSSRVMMICVSTVCHLLPASRHVPAGRGDGEVPCGRLPTSSSHLYRFLSA